MSTLLWVALGVAAAGTLACGLIIGLMLLCAAVAMRAEDRRPDEPGDDLMAVADGLGYRQAQLWTGQRLLGLRLGADYIASAEADADWHALEYMATGKRTEVTR